MMARKSLFDLFKPGAKLAKAEQELVQQIAQAARAWNDFKKSGKKQVFGVGPPSGSGPHDPSLEEFKAFHEGDEAISKMLEYCSEGKRKPLDRNDYGECGFIASAEFHSVHGKYWARRFRKNAGEAGIPIDGKLLPIIERDFARDIEKVFAEIAEREHGVKPGGLHLRLQKLLHVRLQKFAQIESIPKQQKPGSKKWLPPKTPVGRLFFGKKPKSLWGGASKKQRNEYKNLLSQFRHGIGKKQKRKP